jgi:UDP-3-O-[3-hydroxymyristoyl] glucosamine N-acyltransferase
MIYLWIDHEGWKEFELTDTAELVKRGIYIGNGTSIGDRVSIGNGAFIANEVSVGNRASIGKGVSVGYKASIADGAFIGNGTFIAGGVSVGYGASVGKGVSIGCGASIGHKASIADGIKPIVINITGSRFPVSYWGEDRVDIGCQSRSIDAWLNDYTDIAKKHDFTVGEVEEYHGYVEFIKSIHNRESGASRMIGGRA